MGMGGGGGGGGLFLESPPAAGNALSNNNHMMPPSRYGQSQPYGGATAVGISHVESNITIRVFLRVLNSDEVEDVAPSKLSKEQQQALFKELMQKTPLSGQEGGQHPIIYDGADQVYIDVNITF